MTAVADRASAPTASSSQTRPEPPRPPAPVYLGLLVLAVAAFIYFWWARESTDVLFLPLGGFTLWAPTYPLLGFLAMLAVLALCWKIRVGGLAAFGALTFIILTYWGGARVNFTVMPIFERWTNLEPMYQAFITPNWSYLLSTPVRTGSPVWGDWLITLWMAVAATIIGCLIGLLLAMLASPVASPNKAISQVAKAINSVIRSIPDVAYALLFAAIIGTGATLGALSAVLALVMFNIGIMAKLLGESIDAVQPGPIEAADAAGANLLQRNRVAVLPQVMRPFVSYGLYIFELNIRASTALGVVGVAGIGNELMYQYQNANWQNLAALIYALVIVVLLVDMLSLWIRRRL